MSKKTFTRGPWRAHESGDGTHMIAADYIDVADTRGSVNEEANARLIAAAPCLLAACQALVAEWDEVYGSASEDTPAVARIRATIARATGEAL